MSKSYSLKRHSRFALSLMLCLGCGAVAPMSALAEPQAAPQQLTPQQREAMRAQIEQKKLASIVEKFRAADLNHDGYIDAKEIEAEGQKSYKQVTRAEAAKKAAMTSEAKPTLQAHMEAMRAMIQPADANRDGRISEEEYLNAHRAENMGKGDKK